MLKGTGKGWRDPTFSTDLESNDNNFPAIFGYNFLCVFLGFLGMYGACEGPAEQTSRAGIDSVVVQ